MTEEPILKVSLKEYKQGIDDLRASLLTLESTSQEYQDTAEEIRDRQSKLNEVMSVGKKDVDAVAGSYNALSQEMSKLKKEWKNMEMGTQAWKDMAVRINEMNDRLKEADASVGVFSRNVGDYANAFSTAFEKSIDGLGKMDGMLGASAKTIKQLIPIIKQANSTAVKGLNGVKAALVSTGIGALIVGVGLLISNWDKLTKIINKSRKENEKLIESEKTLNEKFEEQDRLLENQITILQAQGKSTAEVNAEKNKLIETQLNETRATIQETKAKIAEIEAHSWFRRVITGEQGDLKGLKKTLEDLEKIEKNLSDSKDKNNASTAAYYETQKQKAKEAYEAEEQKVKELLKTIEDANKTEIQKLTEKYNEELKLLKKHHKSTKALTEKYNKDLAAIERNRLAAERNAYKALLDTNSDINPFDSFKNSIKEAKDEAKKFIEITGKEFPPKGLREAVSQGKELGDEFKDLVGFAQEALEEGLISTDSPLEFATAWLTAFDKVRKAERDFLNEVINYNSGNNNQIYEQFSPINNDTIEKDLAVAETKAKYLADTIAARVTKATNDYFKSVDKDIDARGMSIKEMFDNVQAINKENKNGTDEQKLAYQEFIYYYNLFIEKEKEMNQLDKERLGRQMEIKQLELDTEAEEAARNKSTSPWKNDVNIKDAYEARLSAAANYFHSLKEMQFDSDAERIAAMKAAEQEIYDIQREYNEMKWKNHLDFFNQVADIFGSIGSIYDEHINHQKEQLKEQGKTDEEANAMLEDKFKAMKAFQIAQATINTISGAITAFMESQKLGQPWGTIIGAAQAAAVTAAGVAQIQKIANTTIGNTQAPSSIPSTQLPNVAEYNPQNVQNVTSASDEQRLQGLLESTNIVVNVSDIDRAQKRVRVRDGEASF